MSTSIFFSSGKLGFYSNSVKLIVFNKPKITGQKLFVIFIDEKRSLTTAWVYSRLKNHKNLVLRQINEKLKKSKHIGLVSS